MMFVWQVWIIAELKVLEDGIKVLESCRGQAMSGKINFSA